MTLAGKPGGYVLEHTLNDVDSDYETTIYDQNVAHVVEFLKIEGFRPEITETGRVYFKFEGHHVYFEANPNDEQQFTLIIPDLWPIEPEERDLAIRTAHLISERFRCIKAVILESNKVWVLYEGFHNDVAAFTAILNRTVERLQYGARRFVDVFNETKQAKVLN